MKYIQRFSVCIPIMIFLILIISGCRKDISSANINSKIIDFSNGGELVQTPYGWKPKAFVHLIEPGTYLMKENGRYKKVDQITNKILEDFGEVSPKLNNGFTSPEDNKSLRKFSDLIDNQIGPSGFPSGYVTYAQFLQSPTNPITYFATSWTVPPAPTTNDQQTVFLWNGLWDGVNDVVQPVLQWGITTADGQGGGPNWYIACWYAAQPYFYHGTFIPVNTGVNLQGIVGGGSSGNNTFSYSAKFSNYSNSINISGVSQLSYTIEALEAVNISKTSDFPYGTYSDERMTGINMLTSNGNPTITWSPEKGPGATYDQFTNVINNGTKGSGEVDLYFIGCSQLTVPISNFNWNDTTTTLSWSPVNGAKSYEISSVSGPLGFPPYNTTLTSIPKFFNKVLNDSIPPPGSYEISIYPINDCGNGPTSYFTFQTSK
jgi:hypothetical protein